MQYIIIIIIIGTLKLGTEMLDFLDCPIRPDPYKSFSFKQIRRSDKPCVIGCPTDTEGQSSSSR